MLTEMVIILTTFRVDIDDDFVNMTTSVLTTSDPAWKFRQNDMIPLSALECFDVD